MNAEWVEVLRSACQKSSQGRVAKRLNISASAVSLILKGAYPADSSKIEARVRGEYMAERVDCPVVGDLSRRQCCDYQQLPFAATNPQRVALWRACRHCPHSFIQEEPDADPIL
ncbi:XRE family transcriptional regulator [Synechococcales cyanobacterium C]|uniref:XRE family transcriptional regulator n=1 Tax=Petrachloros mirabilis ULC683 TaxID=2781853 RepID=A0A8K2A791_9CYAN|nr:XRE family transcriptional regulator [Petrachloros mirabilis]NCJ06651.1 XRE family transcriptional regulator [Petrachloros mirabilis ULC683]